MQKKGGDITDLFLEWGVGYEEVGPKTFLINEPKRGWYNLVISIVDDVVVVRLEVMDLPNEAAKKVALMEEVLRKNADDLMFGAYALSSNRLFLVNTLLYETMDPEELQSTLDALSLALVEHFPILSKYKD